MLCSLCKFGGAKRRVFFFRGGGWWVPKIAGHLKETPGHRGKKGTESVKSEGLFSVGQREVSENFRKRGEC